MIDTNSVEDRLPDTATLTEVIEKVNAIIDLISPEQPE
tara:strand:- start:210 stop:323 length:114 start_codon:yes stop_codon:yes gene_type:complete